MDGADWLQTFVEIHRRDAVRILDFPHAAEHLSKLLEALRGRGHAFPAEMLERCLPNRGVRPWASALGMKAAPPAGGEIPTAFSHDEKNRTVVLSHTDN
jgi:hypothetical protein